MKKRNTLLMIDGENISARKGEKIVDAAKNQGILFEGKVYGRQKDPSTRNWTDKAKQCALKDIRLYGSPEKNKVDRKIQKDAGNEVCRFKNIDIVCLATSDGGYVPLIRSLRSQGKRVVVIGEEKAPRRLRESCSQFIRV